MTAQIDLRPQDRAIVQSILTANLPEHAEVWVFGSRASGTTRRSSDLDLAIDAGRALTRAELGALHDQFEDSDLPFTVDILDWRALHDDFRTAIANTRLKLERS